MNHQYKQYLFSNSKGKEDLWFCKFLKTVCNFIETNSLIVKGDTIAGIIIVIVNIVGGLCVGMGMNQMQLGDAVSKYTVLTIGDGLSSQLPSLLMSISAGIVMTRASAGNASLGGDLTNQIMSKPYSLFFAALFLGLITVTSPITGLPFLPFLIFTIVLAVAGFSVLA